VAFRDEHEAALQRARTLERELKRAEAGRRRAEIERAAALRERDEATAQLHEARRKLGEAPLVARDSAHAGGGIRVVGLVAVAAIAVLGFGLCRSTPTVPKLPDRTSVEQRSAAPLMCEIETRPAGARIFDSRRRLIAVSPSVVARDRLAGGPIEIRLDGYERVRVAPPKFGGDCGIDIAMRPSAP